MGNFNRDRGGFNRDRGERTMYKAICSDCGKNCEIPFQPRSDKPVYCSDCFRGKREGSNSSRPTSSGRTDFNRSDRGDRGDRGSSSSKQFDALNIKLDKLITLLSSHAQSEKPAIKIKETEKVSPVKKSIKTAKKTVAKIKSAVKKTSVKKVKTKKKSVAKKKK